MFCYVWGRAEATVRKYFNLRPYHVIVIAHNFIHSLLLNVDASVPILRSLNLTESKFKTRSLHQNNTDVDLLICLLISMFFVTTAML
jgi:hypothetical protein